MAKTSKRVGSMRIANPPCMRTRSVVVPGTRMRSCPTTSMRKLVGASRNVRVAPVPAPKLVGGASHGGSLVAGVARPGRVSVSQRSVELVLMASVPLPNMNTPNGSSALKSVSSVITPQNSTSPEVSRTNRPAVEPTVPRPMILSEPLKSSVKTWRAKSSSMRTLAFTSTRSTAPAALRITPPESSMKNDWARVMTANCCVPAAPGLPAASAHAPSVKATVTTPVSKLLVNPYRKLRPAPAPASVRAARMRVANVVSDSPPTRVRTWIAPTCGVMTACGEPLSPTFWPSPPASVNSWAASTIVATAAAFQPATGV